MAIQRAAALPAPAPEVSQARATLARRYGATVWDGPDRRVLLVRTPGKEPDPVNHVEEAVEFLRPDDVKGITHCLLVGDEAVAQVYTRPLQDLMRQREAFDRGMAASWRERLPGTLSHVLFQAPEDPRRRWRLAVRIPAGSIQELDEAVLEDLADAMGPELETSRMKQVCAVYLIASHDDVRLEADLFLQEMTTTWQDEDRRRRAELAQAQRRDEERRRKEAERRRIVAEMERKMSRSAASARAAPVRRGGSTASGARAGLPADPQDARGTAGSAAADAGANAGSPLSDARSGAARPLAESTATITARPEVRHLRDQVDRLPAGPWLPDNAPAGLEAAAHLVEQQDEQAAAVDKLDELRDRVDRAVKAAPVPSSRMRGRAGVGRTTASGGTPTTGRAASGDRAASRDRMAAPDRTAGLRRASPGAAPDDGATVSNEARPISTRLVPARDFLVAAGFEVLEAPATTHAIDLAAERAEGDPQRVVVRVVERLDPEVAKGLLKTARELEVDLVLCVADHVDPEGKRLLVATKIKVIGPADLAKMTL